jgi:hypothetical protein
MFVLDHASTDDTGEVLAQLSDELDHLHVQRVSHAARSHALIEGLAGTDTWVLAVDGDELYDPAPLQSFRRDLEAGAYREAFRLRPAGLHCDALDLSRREATGYLSPPSRPLLGLFNFAAIESWRGVRTERLHGGEPVFREGYDWDSWRHLGMECGWDESPLRDLHVCFVRRSSLEAAGDPVGRPNLSETRRFRRGVLGTLERATRRALGRGSSGYTGDASWKDEKYRRGERFTTDASPFFS